jgi:hypothetical protein
MAGLNFFYTFFITLFHTPFPLSFILSTTLSICDHVKGSRHRGKSAANDE